MRLIFFGTPEFAVPSFVRLADGPEHEVVGVVSQPDRPRGRGRSVSPSPVSAAALERGLPLLRPERVGEPDVAHALAGWQADLGVVVAFGQFLPKRIRELPGQGYLINAHASILPRHRGAAPIQHAILCGDATTGISVMRVEREMDAGAVATLRTLTIGAEETAGELTSRLAALAAEALVDGLAEIAAGTVRWTEQDHAAATLAPKLGASDQDVDWSQPALAIARRVRALAPAPGVRTRLDDQPLRILAARAQPGACDRPPGQVSSPGDETLRVATGDGWLVPTRLQRAGGKPLATADFLRGRAIPDGALLT